MDLQRSLLIGAIAVLSFMLLTEWVGFKDEKASSQVVQTERIISNGDAQPGEVPQLGAASAAAAMDDVPSAPDEAQATTAPAAATAPATRTVQVHTDSLQLAIDLEGGDIIEVALPRHLDKIDNPDVPFVLLEKNGNRTYISQSGLIC